MRGEHMKQFVVRKPLRSCGYGDDKACEMNHVSRSITNKAIAASDAPTTDVFESQGKR